MIKHLETEKVWPTIVKSVNTVIDQVKLTFGPAANKFLISKDLGHQIVDDGAQIIRDFRLEDEFENAVLKFVRQVAEKTNSRVGDGTTSSLIILQAIINEVAILDNSNTHTVVKELQKGVKEAIQQLQAKAKKITKLEDLEKVARISFDNEKISKEIAKLVYKVGHEGVITVQESNEMETKSEIVDGFEFPKGYISPYMATNPERMEAEHISVPVFVTDYKFSLATDALQLMEKLLKAKIPRCVLVCEGVEGDALATFVVNRIQGKFDMLAIETPGFEEEKTQFQADLAAITGAKVFKRDLNKLDDFSLDWLGEAERVISKPDNTVIIGGKGKKSEIKKQVEETKILISKATGLKLERLQQRLGRLVNGVAVIKVGAPTEHEMRALKYKVEDAVNAVKVAYKSGIVCGAGLSLKRLKTSSNILNEALKKPTEQLFLNSGIDEHDKYYTHLNENALNVVTGESGDCMKVGVIDPVEVLIAGVESAVSIATLLIETKGILVEVKDKEAK